MLHTVSVRRKGFTIKLTQDYNERCDFGHIKGAIENSDGDIVGVHSSLGGPPSGKLDEMEAESILNKWLHDMDITEGV